jgi:hypothetical protein
MARVERVVRARSVGVLVVAIACAIGLLACGDDSPPACIAYAAAPGGRASGAGGVGGRGGAGAARTGGGGVAGSIGGRGGGPAAAGRGGSGGNGGAAGRGGAAGTSAGAGGAGRGGTAGSAGGATGGTASPQVPTPGYSGCSHSGGVDKIRLTKFQSPSGLCFDVELSLSTKAPPAGLTLPQNWTLTTASARPCSVVGAPTVASGATGTVDWPPQFGFALPPTIDVDLTLAFSAAGSDAGVPASERLTGQNIDVQTVCPP